MNPAKKLPLALALAAAAPDRADDPCRAELAR
jgi:hypothetical protein